MQLQNHKHVQLDNPDMDAILKTHAIDPTFLRRDDFEGFLTDRQQTLLKKIEFAMGKTIISSGEPDIGEYLDDEEE